MVDNKYNEIIEHLKEAKVDLEDAEDSIKDMLKKIRVYVGENFDKEQFDKREFLRNEMEYIEEIIEEIEDVILDLQDPSRL